MCYNSFGVLMEIQQFPKYSRNSALGHPVHMQNRYLDKTLMSPNRYGHMVRVMGAEWNA